MNYDKLSRSIRQYYRKGELTSQNDRHHELVSQLLDPDTKPSSAASSLGKFIRLCFQESCGRPNERNVWYTSSVDPSAAITAMARTNPPWRGPAQEDNLCDNFLSEGSWEADRDDDLLLYHENLLISFPRRTNLTYHDETKCKAVGFASMKMGGSCVLAASLLIGHPEFCRTPDSKLEFPNNAISHATHPRCSLVLIENLSKENYKRKKKKEREKKYNRESYTSDLEIK